MSRLQSIFYQIEKLIHTEGNSEFDLILKNITLNENKLISNDSFLTLKSFLEKIFSAIDKLATELKNDNTILISVRNQKHLRTCFQLITSLGISPCLIPGLGIKLSKRCNTGAAILPKISLADEQKYDMLVECTDFFTRCYCVSALKTIIITLHLSDYLAALIQLSFAPFKKPGTYKDFTMTQEMYDKLVGDRKTYVSLYNHLVTNSFQPVLMKELLVLQSGTEPTPPAFAKRVIAKELSQRLIAPGGLLSLIRCFIESYVGTGFDWKKIDMICRIITATHGSNSESEYLANICSQLQEILSLNNTHYLGAGVACILHLNDKFPKAEPVIVLFNEVFQSFDYTFLTANCNLPGTIILSPQEVEQKINVLYVCVCSTKLDWPVQLLIPNLYLIYLIGVKCTKNDELKTKLKDIILNSLEKLGTEELFDMIKTFLFGKAVSSTSGILVEEFDAGVAVKSVPSCEDYVKDEAVIYFMNLFRSATDDALVTNIFTIALKILIDLNDKRRKKGNIQILSSEDDPVLIDEVDQQYAVILQLLSEICTSPKVVNSLKTNPMIVSDFIEHFILKQNSDTNDECVTIALVLLNTILSNLEKEDVRFNNLIPVLKRIGDDDSSLNSILSKEALSLITQEAPKKKDTACEKAISDIFDELLPVTAHGIIELTKLIDAGDAETISKKHYIFCIFQEKLKDPDSYIYLSAVNGLAALCTHCTDDVLQILCKEFLQEQKKTKQSHVETNESQNKDAELRMKIGDVIVKVTKRLGEMAIVHKTILLNTMLCAATDVDPLIRTSALSNLAEIALVLHYRIGSIIYEVLYCIWSIIETDKAIECRRAAVMVISSLLKGLGKDTLPQLKDNLLPIYRTLKTLYKDNNEDEIVKLHAQIALEELNDIVNQFLFPVVKMEKKIFVLDESQDVFK